MVGQFSVVATRFIDNVGLLALTNQAAAAMGIMPGNPTMDLFVFLLLSILYAILIFFGVKVSYFIKYYNYCVGFASGMYLWLLVLTILDMNTEYPTGFTVLSFIGGLVGTT